MKRTSTADLEYDPVSLAGPVDMRVVSFLEGHGKKLDASYLRHARRFHGGVPGKQYFDAGGKTYRLGRFLTLLDSDSELQPPRVPSWEFPGQDARIDRSVVTLMYTEGNTCRQLFSGERLLPFAALYWGPHHPDGMSLTDGNVDLLCFFYGPGERRPPVVLWRAHEASREYFRWQDDIESPVRYEDFTAPVAPDFDAFLKLLRKEP